MYKQGRWLRGFLVTAVSPIVLAIVILFGLITFTAYQQFFVLTPDLPELQSGRLALASDKEVPIQLKGSWGFYWKQLLTPAELDDSHHWAQLPSRWRDVQIDNQFLSAPGFATYVANIQFEQRNHSLGLRLPMLYRAASVWINGELMARVGQPGITAEDEIPRDEIKIIALPDNVTELEVVIQVSSFHHVDGGINQPIVIDRLADLEQDERWRVMRGIFLLASTLTLSFYLLIMWAYAGAGREYFYLGVGLFWYAVMLFGKERLIFYLYPDFSVEWQMRAVYFGMFLCVPAYMLFIQSIFPRDISYKLLRVFWYTGILASLITVVANSSWYTLLRDPYETLTLLFIAYFILCLVRIIWYRREWGGVVGFLGGVTSLLFINEALFSRGIIDIQLTPWAYIFVALTSFIFLGQRMNTRLSSESEQNAQLSKAVEIRTQELQNKITELDAARRHAVDMAHRRTEFMAVLSHEVRTPLSGLLGALRLLSHKKPIANEEELQRHALEAGESLLAVVNNTLDVTAMEHRQIVAPSCQQLTHSFASIASIMTISANNKNLLFEFTQPQGDMATAWVLADYQKLRQITVNLLSNAIKFTEQGKVALAISLIGREDYPQLMPAVEGNLLLVIKVSDTGTGMPTKMLPRIFDAYVQLSHAGEASTLNGSGLGLAITRQLVELQGGVIQVSSEPGKGSCFTVVVPVEPCVPSLLDPEPQQEAIGGLRILVVEDDEINRSVVSALLQQDGNKVVATGSPTQALHQLQGFPFDVLLLDIHLPEMSGMALLGHAQALVAQNIRPLYVAVTANTSESDVEKYRQAGFDYVLEKPVDRTQLRFVLSRVDAPDALDEPFVLANRLSPTVLPDVPIDWEFWLTTVDDLGKDRARDLIKAAQTSLLETFADLTASNNEQSPADISIMAHKLKSAARSVGMLKVAAMADTIEINPLLLPGLSEGLQLAIDEALRQLSASLNPRHNKRP